MKKYSLDCPWYEKSFDTEEELIQDILDSGMDPNYDITIDGMSTNTKAIDLIQI